jgi:hypothetical protein
LTVGVSFAAPGIHEAGRRATSVWDTRSTPLLVEPEDAPSRSITFRSSGGAVPETVAERLVADVRAWLVGSDAALVSAPPWMVDRPHPGTAGVRLHDEQDPAEDDHADQGRDGDDAYAGPAPSNARQRNPRWAGSSARRFVQDSTCDPSAIRASRRRRQGRTMNTMIPSQLGSSDPTPPSIRIP